MFISKAGVTGKFFGNKVFTSNFTMSGIENVTSTNQINQYNPFKAIDPAVSSLKTTAIRFSDSDLNHMPTSPNVERHSTVGTCFKPVN